MIRICVLILLAAIPAFTQTTWKLRIDEDSIRIWTGYTDESRIKTIRSEFTLRASREALLRALMQVERYPEWQYNALDCRVVEKISATEMLYYCEVAAPWPVANRDMVIRLKVLEGPGPGVLRVTTHSDDYPFLGRPELIRVPMSVAEWHIRQVGPEMLKVGYTIRVDPGGSVPAWVINLVAAQAPFQTFKALKRRLE